MNFEKMATDLQKFKLAYLSRELTYPWALYFPFAVRQTQYFKTFGEALAELKGGLVEVDAIRRQREFPEAT